MKTYKVLEAHQGDKFYKPGDPETGTRVADPNAVQHLVTLGLLEETGDAPDAPVSADESGASVFDLQAQVASLTQERDDARADLSALRTLHDANSIALTDARGQIATATNERDDLHQKLTEALGRVETLTSELTEARAVKTTGNRDRSAN